MNIYQLQYTRLGHQGSGAGWQVAAATKGTPQIAANVFYKIASNLVALKADGEMPREVWDIQIQENYAFLSHVNYDSRNIGEETDIRGVSFVHAYVFRAEDFMQALRCQEQVLMWREDAFEKDYRGCRELPAVDSLPVQPAGMENLTRAGLMRLCGLTEEGYGKLMSCVYAALNSPAGSLCLCSQRRGLEEFEELAKKITWLVYDGLPYLLRMKLSVFSYRRTGAVLYFSRRPGEGEHYFDLDTMESRSPEPPSYDFIRACINQDSEGCRKLYEDMDRFTDVTYGNHYGAVRLQHIELAYHGVTAQKIPTEKLDDYMREASGIKAYRYDFLDKYYNMLLEQYLEEGREMPQEAYRRMQRRYVETELADLKRNFLFYFADIVCVSGNTGAYETVYRFQTENPPDYEIIRNRLQERRPEFLSAYYLDYYMDAYIDTLERWGTFANENSMAEPRVAERLFQILDRLFRKGMVSLKSNEERYQLCRRCAALAAAPGHLLPDWEAGFCRSLKEEYWKQFQEEQFSYDAVPEYREMGLREPKIPVPGRVERLLLAGENLARQPDPEEYREIFLEGTVIRDGKKRKQLVEELRRKLKAGGNGSLDSWLLINWQGESGFDLERMAEDMRDCGMEMVLRDPEMPGGFCDSRILTAGSHLLETFKSQLQEKEKQERGNGALVWIHVYRYYFPRMGKRERRDCLVDYVQKWMFFLALIPAVVLAGKNAFHLSAAAGYGAFAAAAVLAVAAMGLNLFFGMTKTAELFDQLRGVAVGVTAVAVILGAAMAAALLLLDSFFAFVGAAVFTALMLVGRIVLLCRTIYS